MDARANIEQNVNFLLRGATVEQPIIIDIPTPNGGYYESGYSNFVSTGFFYLEPGSGAQNGAQLDEFHPYEDSSVYDYLVYAPNSIDTNSGNLINGVVADDVAGSYPLFNLTSSSEVFQPSNYFSSGNYTSIPAILGPPTNFIMSFYNVGDNYDALDGCVSTGTHQLTLETTAKNFYGLTYDAVTYEVSGNTFGTVSTGDSFTYNIGGGSAGWWFHSVAAPSLSTVGYYFARPNIDPLPGESGFSTTITTPSNLMVGVGQSFTVTGWAKQAVGNGYSDVFAYPEQYFDKAYKADAGGNATTNQTGILSEYGEFFATEPGEVILTTKPDGATGLTGQCAVNVIKMALDVNHDGTMDLTYAGPDNTSADRPFRFWVNNDCDAPANSSSPDRDIDISGQPALADYVSGKINSQRDLEDYARLWICGLPALSNGYQVTLSWNVLSGNPSIEIFSAWDSDGGIGYLTNENSAFFQTLPGYGTSLGTVTNGSPLLLLPDELSQAGNSHFLFEGAGIGEGELVLTVSQNGTTIASTSVFIDLHDIKDLYERAAIGEINNGVLSNITSQLTVENPLMLDPTEDTNLIVMVHGINVDDWHWRNASETVFERLYWAGYLGKFATVKWPCDLLTPIPQPLTPPVFNLSELHGYKASTALKSYLSQLHARFPGYRVNVIAHSQGNTVVSEAIRQGASFDTYILTQGALPDSAYDVNAPTNDLMASYEAAAPTPEWQPMGYHGIYTNFNSNFPGRIVNFYNALDKVLGYWVNNQELVKPSITFNFSQYFYDGTNSYYVPSIGSRYLVTDPQESRSMVSRSRTLSIGQSGPASPHGVIQSAVDLNAQFGFNGSTVDEHSAQWTRPIQTCLPYYNQILVSIKPLQ
jgi:hypothetical protein